MTKARDVADLLANGTVDTNELADGLITTAKLADNSVTTAKISDAAITAAKLSVQGSDIPYDNTTSGISANTLQEAIDYLNVLSGGGSAGAQATYTREKFTATAGQTTFTTVNGYTLGYLQVFMNGIMLDTSDYAATDESTVVLGTGAAAGDEIVTIAYDSFAISEVLRTLNISASAPDDALEIGATGKVTVKGSGTYSNGGEGLIVTTANTSSRATARISSTGDQPAEIFFDVDGAIRWDISARDSSSGHELHFYRQAAVPGNTVNSFAMRMTQEGYILAPNQPAFAYKNTSYTQTSGGWSIIIPGTTLLNRGSHFNGSTGVFTAPVSGFYVFGFWGLSYPHNTEVNSMAYYRNGVSQSGMQFAGNSSNHQIASGGIGLSLSANDTVDLRYFQYTGGGKAYSAQWHMWGYLVS